MSENIDLPTTQKDLLKILEKQEVAYKLYEHEPIFTVEQGEPLKKSIPGVHCRNLFLRDKKKRMFLITAANETKIDLKKLSSVLDCGRLSFGSAERLWDNLGIKQGSVNPFCIMNDKQGQVRIILDKYMMEQEIMNVHPMDNAFTVGLSPLDLTRFIESTDHKAEVFDLSMAAPDA